jgi:hypothetical protein
LLKKAGIVAAVATAGLLAVSPIAFAGGGGHHHDGRDGNRQAGLINLQNTNVQVPVQLCNNSIIEGTLGVLARNQKNSDSHKGKCKQDNEADNGHR